MHFTLHTNIMSHHSCPPPARSGKICIWWMWIPGLIHFRENFPESLPKPDRIWWTMVSLLQQVLTKIKQPKIFRCISVYKHLPQSRSVAKANWHNRIKKLNFHFLTKQNQKTIFFTFWQNRIKKLNFHFLAKQNQETKISPSDKTVFFSLMRHMRTVANIIGIKTFVSHCTVLNESDWYVVSLHIPA